MKHSASHAPTLLIAAVSLLVACANPAVDARIEALGEEPNPDLQDFQYHRPGQPCVLCHGEYEEEEPIMSVGGTVYRKPGSLVPASGVTVLVWDSSGAPPKEKTTNCVGNFWFTKEEFPALFPLHVRIKYKLSGELTNDRVAQMDTRIGREGSCAGCHTNTTVTQQSPGRVFLTEDENAVFDPIIDCPVPPPVDVPAAPSAPDGGT